MTKPVPGKAQGVCSECGGLSNVDACANCGLPELHGIHQDHQFYSSGCAKCGGTGREPAEAPNEISRCGHSDQMHGVTFSATICSGGNCDCTMYWPVKKAEAEGRPKRPEEIYDTRALAYIEALESHCTTLESRLEKLEAERDQWKIRAEMATGLLPATEADLAWAKSQLSSVKEGEK